MGLGKRIKQAISEINLLMCNSAANRFLCRCGSAPSHRAHGLLWVSVYKPQLRVHGEDIKQVHRVGAPQKAFVRVQDEIIVLQACRAGGQQVKFVQQ